MTREEILAEKKKLKNEYGQLFDRVSGILFRYDPIGINFETNTDEYDPEARTILPKLRNCDSAENVRKVIHEEFQFWFGEDMAGREEDYKGISEEIWELWQNKLN